MARFSLLIDNDLCFDCKACEVACKQENNVAEGLRWIRVIPVGPVKVGENLVCKFIPSTCHHCARPACVEACPVSAIHKRSDGIVLVDPDLCFGCGACIPACPFSVIGINPQSGVAEKCTLCAHRVEQGLIPACVMHCEAGAIYFGDINDISQQMREDRTQRASEPHYGG
ncbi:MAG: 4Fe-4S dicluster domain-containing protein [Deltaproteobacteria bacterium]|nr:4Fe-4S dicluster domain-containing protein [Deltaproteobacteria bacterium]